MRVRVDAGGCVASGMCALLAPEVFDQSDRDGVVVVLREAPPEEQRAAVREAVRGCPARVIRLEDEPSATSDEEVR